MVQLRTRVSAVIAGLIACVTLVLAQGTGTASAAASPWSAAYGPASAAGRYRGEPGPEPYSWDYVFDGQVENTGSGCYSVWFVVVYDLHFPRVTKAGTQCGAGAAPAHFRFPSWGVPTNVEVAVCKGSENYDDCGPWEFVATFW